MQIKTILVTGGAGFIGSNLCDKLLTLGHKVICVDNFDNYYPPEFKRQNIVEASKDRNFTIYETDITNYAKVANVFENHKIDTIVHLAGRGGVTPSINDPFFYLDTNVRGTLCMLEATRQFRVPQFIFASSSSVYGPDSKVPFSEDQPCSFQVSPYGATKRAAELLIRTYHNLYNIHATIFRFFTVYGPRTRPDMALYQMTEEILVNKPVSHYPKMARDFTYVEDIISGIVSAINKNLSFEIINLGNSKPIPHLQYIQAIEKALEMKAKMIIKEPRSGEVLVTMANISKAKKMLGFKPKTSVFDGVKQFVLWYKKYRQ